MYKDLDLFKGLTSSLTIEMTSTMNITNSTLSINSTMETNKVFEELEVISYITFIVLGIIGNYLIFNIQRYLETKPPGAKTILDEFYITLLSYWIFECVWFAATKPLLTFLKDVPWLLLVIVVSATNLIFIVSHLHLFLCLVCNILMIYKPNLIENVDDKKAIKSAL